MDAGPSGPSPPAASEALTLARELAHPFSLVYALSCAAVLHQLRREGPAAQARAEATIALASEQGFTLWLAHGDHAAGLGASRARASRAGNGAAAPRPGSLSGHGGRRWHRPISWPCWPRPHLKAGQAEEGLRVLAEALAAVHDSGERCYEAELYRLQGELLLAQAGCSLRQRRKPVFSKPSPLPAASRRSHWSCGRP